MSVDLSLEQYEVNVTYNLADMWRESLGILHLDPEEWPERFRGDSVLWKTFGLEGMTGRESIPVLTSCLAALDANEEGFRELEPGNGWGDVEWFRGALEKCLEAAREHPGETWRAFR